MVTVSQEAVMVDQALAVQTNAHQVKGDATAMLLKYVVIMIAILAMNGELTNTAVRAINAAADSAVLA